MNKYAIVYVTVDEFGYKGLVVKKELFDNRTLAEEYLGINSYETFQFDEEGNKEFELEDTIATINEVVLQSA